MSSDKKTYSFNKLNQVAISVVLLLAVGLTGCLWVFGEYQAHEKKIERLREDYLAIRKLESKTLVNNVVNGLEFQKDGIEKQLQKSLKEYSSLAWDISNSLYQQYRNQMAPDELKKLIIDTLMPIRFFDGRGYFWVHDIDYRLVAHPFRVHSIGKDDSDLTDTKGQKITKLFVDTAITDSAGGIVNYYWNKPDIDEKYHIEEGKKKIAYVRHFEPFNWVIGVGEYVEDVEVQIQKAMYKRLANVRHGEKGYIFGHTSDGVCVAHTKKENIGVNRWELTDASGMKVVQALARVGQQPGGGFLEYVGSINPDTGKPAKKISFVRSVKGWNWTIGSGVYVADIEGKLLDYRNGLLAELKHKIGTTLVLLLFILVIGFVVGNLFFKGLIRELNLFVSYSADKSKKPIDVNQFRISELRTIADRANALLLDREKIQTDLSRAKRMESIGLMAGGVAHDLNNILSSIIGYPELLLRKLPEDSELRVPIIAMHDSGKRAAAVVADLLTVARSVACTKEVHNLNTLVMEYLESPEFVELKGCHADVNYQYSLEADAPMILCSSVHVKKCLMNLVDNATESLGHYGEVEISTFNRYVSEAESESVELDPGSYVCVRVCDNGSGILPKDLEHIFEPFYSKKEMGRSGTGLGLTVVWNTMDDHGGKIKVTSDDDGTCIQLLFVQSHDLQKHVRNITDKKPERGNLEKVLVVDDEPDLRDIACQMLEELGYDVKSVSSGEAALEYVKHEPVELLVIDMLMGPGMNGRETFEVISNRYPGIKAIIVSGFSENDEVEEALRLGASGFVQKPYSMEQLGNAVNKCFCEEYIQVQ